MKPARSRNFDCGSRCMLGCRCRAKWNAAEYVDEAVEGGAALFTRAFVKRVLVKDGHVIGVEGTMRGKAFSARAERVVLAAGGIGSPRILQASGFPEAGTGMAMDITVMLYGTSRGTGNGNEPPMTWSWEDREAGFMLSTLVDPWLLYPIITGLKGPKYALTWSRWNNTLGVMIKLKDEISGGVFPDGRVSKPMTENDHQRLKQAEETSRKILIEAGADLGSIFMTPMRGTHPSGTVRIGDMVDADLQTQVQGLYVCDASVFPEALGQPTVLTIISLAKRLARHLLDGETPRKEPEKARAQAEA